MLRFLIAAPLILTATAAAIPSCPTNPVRSCTAAAGEHDSCCVASPGGRFEFTQRFEPDVGSEGGSWGIESLNVLGCDGQDIRATGRDSTRQYTHEEVGSYCASSQAFGSNHGFELAEKEWAQSEVGESVEEVWERAWANSGRQISTLHRKCLESYKTGDEVPLFFEGIHRLHRSLPSARRLADADITPSMDTTYSLSELQRAVTIDGHQPTFHCNNVTLSTITYTLNLLGRFQDGRFEPAEAGGEQSNCPSDGIHYPPSAVQATVTPSSTWDPVLRPSPRAITLSEDPEKRIAAEPTEKAPAKKLGIFKKQGEKLAERKAQNARDGRDEL